MKDQKIKNLPVKVNSLKVSTNKTCFPLGEDSHKDEPFDLTALHWLSPGRRILTKERYFLSSVTNAFKEIPFVFLLAWLLTAFKSGGLPIPGINPRQFCCFLLSFCPNNKNQHFLNNAGTALKKENTSGSAYIHTKPIQEHRESRAALTG